MQQSNVSVGQSLPGAMEDGSYLNVHTAARVAGVSESTLRRLIADGFLDVVREGPRAKILIARKTAMAIRMGGTAGLKRAPTLPAREEQQARGDLARACFEKFASGMALARVVQELAVDPTLVKLLWTQWLDIQDTERRSDPPRCVFHGSRCAGVVARRVGLCEWHAPRARMLSEEQEAVLAGQTIPMGLHCAECGKLAGAGLCTACISNPTYVVEPGRVVVKARGRVLLNLSRATLAVCLEQLDELAKPKAPPPPTTLEVPTAPTVPIATIADADDHPAAPDGGCCAKHLLECIHRLGAER